MSRSGYQSFLEIRLRLGNQHKVKESSFFQIKRAGAPWGEQEGWINTVTRFSSMKLHRAASSSWKRSILDCRLEKCLCPEWFWDHMVNGQLICQPWICWICPQNHDSLWEQYSFWPESGKWSQSDQWPQGVRAGLETFQAFKIVCARIHSCMNEGYSWGFCGVTSRTGFRRYGTESRSFGSGADDGSVLTEGELLDSCCDCCWKKMLPSTQSIKGL